ncbi:sulfatase [Tautonia plasticadhaerens]|uniref:Arylsulfatase n=1 Tax=Tautonia plasticadhaerens TaxID=2527974 RepID=A0A518H7L6_9BACT|nr:sulfatase [Tautonia plasticadhaerens]QDV36781.1 Arylsulfatase [Tautonia plasticadhaerens]
MNSFHVIRSGADPQEPRAGGDSPCSTGPRPGGLIALAAWLGLIAGASELAAFLLKARSGEVWPYLGMIRAYPWMIPLVDSALLTMLVLPIAAMSAAWPRTRESLGPILLLAAAMLPTLIVLTPGIHLGALALVALGLSSVIVPAARRRSKWVARLVRFSTPILLLALLAVITWRNGRVGAAGATEAMGNGPNVLMIVLDTVRFDHLSLDGSGYPRPTSPVLAAFAREGVSLTGARSTAPWTLPSHASLMTGKWASQACHGRYGAMEPDGTTLAEALAARGYDTAGFVANTYYCTYSTGLSRGFSRYEDLTVTLSTVLTTTAVGGKIVDWIGSISQEIRPDAPPLLRRYTRIDADAINRRFLGWLDRRAGENRPFFAFLNYFDAHDPYIVPDGAEHRFGEAPDSLEDRRFLGEWWLSPGKPDTPPGRVDLLVDGYDSCIAHLDERLGALFRDLDRRGLLDDTIVVVTSDHGEAFGEHGLYGHGISLFEDQLRVPLVLVAPGRIPASGTVDQVVSLRDVPATILDLVDLPGPTLPGSSLVPLWMAGAAVTSPAIASVDGPDSFPPNSGRSPVFGGAMASVTDETSLKYIRTFGQVREVEQLYDLCADPGEQVDLASPLGRPLLDRLRAKLDAIGSDPEGGGR